MKKQRLCLILSILLLLPSCRSDPLRKDYSVPPSQKPASSQGSSVSEAQTVPSVNNEPPAEGEKCDIHHVVETYFVRDIMGNRTRLRDIAGDIGIDTLRNTGTGSLYGVHQVEQGGRLYITRISEGKRMRITRH